MYRRYMGNSTNPNLFEDMKIPIAEPMDIAASGDGNALQNPNANSNSLVSKKQPQLSKLVFLAITKLNGRTGSSVPAIVKFIKSTGFEVNDNRMFNKSVHRALKRAIRLGKVQQLKRSFKLIKKNEKKKKANASGRKQGQANKAAKTINKKAIKKKSKNSTKADGTGKGKGS